MTEKKKYKKKMGRKSVMNKITLEKLEKAFMMGCTVDEASIYAEIDHSTYYNYIKKHPEYKEKIENLRHRPRLRARMNVVRDIERGNLDTSKWYLERKSKSEFGTRVEMNTQSTIHQFNHDLSREEAKSVIKSLSETLNESKTNKSNIHNTECD